METLTFKMKQHIRLVVLEHLRYKLRVHICEVDFLQVLVEHHDGFVEFFLLLHQRVSCLLLDISREHMECAGA